MGVIKGTKEGGSEGRYWLLGQVDIAKLLKRREGGGGSVGRYWLLGVASNYRDTSWGVIIKPGMLGGSVLGMQCVCFCRSKLQFHRLGICLLFSFLPPLSLTSHPPPPPPPLPHSPSLLFSLSLSLRHCSRRWRKLATSDSILQRSFYTQK